MPNQPSCLQHETSVCQAMLTSHVSHASVQVLLELQWHCKC